jgi:ATP-dependent protease HslVU (ClpYQ) peptidase subunit
LNNAKGRVAGRNVPKDMIRGLLGQAVLHRDLSNIRVLFRGQGILQSLKGKVADALILQTLSDVQTDCRATYRGNKDRRALDWSKAIVDVGPDL